MIWGGGGTENIGRDFFYLAEAFFIFFCRMAFEIFFPGKWPSNFFLSIFSAPQIINRPLRSRYLSKHQSLSATRISCLRWTIYMQSNHQLPQLIDTWSSICVYSVPENGTFSLLQEAVKIYGWGGGGLAQSQGGAKISVHGISGGKNLNAQLQRGGQNLRARHLALPNIP